MTKTGVGLHSRNVLRRVLDYIKTVSIPLSISAAFIVRIESESAAIIGAVKADVHEVNFKPVKNALLVATGRNARLGFANLR